MQGHLRLEEPGSLVATPDAGGAAVPPGLEEGEYQILILSAKDSGGLDTWLRENHYKIPEGAAAALAPHAAKQATYCRNIWGE